MDTNTTQAVDHLDFTNIYVDIKEEFSNDDMLNDEHIVLPEKDTNILKNIALHDTDNLDITNKNREIINMSAGILKNNDEDIADILDVEQPDVSIKDSYGNVDINKSIDFSYHKLLTNIINSTIPFTVAKNINDLDTIITTINASGVDGIEYRDERGVAVNFDKNLVLNYKSILENSLKDNKVENLILEALKQNKYRVIDNESSINYNVIDIEKEDCLFKSMVMYLYFISDKSRSLPEELPINENANILRHRVGEYIYSNRYKIHQSYNNVVYIDSIQKDDVSFGKIRKFLEEDSYYNNTDLTNNYIVENFDKLDNVTKYSLLISQESIDNQTCGNINELVALANILDKNILVFVKSINQEDHYIPLYKIIVKDIDTLPVILLSSTKDDFTDRHYNLLWSKELGEIKNNSNLANLTGLDIAIREVKPIVFKNNDIELETQPINIWSLISKYDKDYTEKLPENFKFTNHVKDDMAKEVKPEFLEEQKVELGDDESITKRETQSGGKRDTDGYMIINHENHNYYKIGNYFYREDVIANVLDQLDEVEEDIPINIYELDKGIYYFNLDNVYGQMLKDKAIHEGKILIPRKPGGQMKYKLPELDLDEYIDPKPKKLVTKKEASILEKKVQKSKKPAVKKEPVGKKEDDKKPDVKKNIAREKPEIKKESEIKKPEIKMVKVDKFPEVNKEVSGNKPEDKKPEVKKEAAGEKPEDKKPEIKKITFSKPNIIDETASNASIQFEAYQRGDYIYNLEQIKGQLDAKQFNRFIKKLKDTNTILKKYDMVNPETSKIIINSKMISKLSNKYGIVFTGC